MSPSDLVRRSLRSLKSAKARTILTALAIAVGGFTLTLTLAANNGARAYSARLIQSNFDPSELLVARDKSIFQTQPSSGPKEYDESQINAGPSFGGGVSLQRLEKNDFEEIAKVEGVESVQPQYMLAPQFITREGQKRYNASMEVYGLGQTPEIIAGNVGESPEKGSLVLPEEYLSVLGFGQASDAIGQTIDAHFHKAFKLDPAFLQLLQGAPPAAQPGQPAPPTPPALDLVKLDELQKPLVKTFTIAAVSRQPAANLNFGVVPAILVNPDDAKELNAYTTENTENVDKFIMAVVKVRDGQNETKLKAVQKLLEDKGYNVQSAADTQELLTSFINYLQYVVTGFGLITLIASVFGIINTQYISVLERTREIGLMKALGMRKNAVNWLFMLEATWIGLLGGLIGTVFAVLVSLILNPPINKALKLGDGNYLLVNEWWQILLLLLLLMLVATLAGLLPARKAAKLDPIEALRTE